MTQNEILLKHLSTVFDPELGANIVELGMIKDIQHVDKTVTIKLALTIAAVSYTHLTLPTMIRV